MTVFTSGSESPASTVPGDDCLGRTPAPGASVAAKEAADVAEQRVGDGDAIDGAVAALEILIV